MRLKDGASRIVDNPVMYRSAVTLQWDIFCKVIDNFGDIGVCWRLAADLASRGHKVRLWADDASALDWMAPGGHEGVSVLPWSEPLSTTGLAALGAAPVDVLIEAFGCEIPGEFIEACLNHEGATGRKPVWINLEYLSAEAYAGRNHSLASPVGTGPAAGWKKWFFYPGFTADTGGLLREQDLTARQQTFARDAWLKQHGIGWHGQALVSLFCYEPPALQMLLPQLAKDGLQGRPVRLLVAAGRAQRAVAAVLGSLDVNPEAPGSRLEVSFLPLMPQTEFDHLLWACDLNFVRGEDSLVRALWAGKPFVWQIYPQDDGVHLGKLEAFLDVVDAPATLRECHRIWNAADGDIPSAGLPLDLQAWKQPCEHARGRFMGQAGLTASLLEFVSKNR